MKEQKSDLSDLERALEMVSTTDDIELIQETVDTYGAKPWYGNKYERVTDPEKRKRQEIARVGVTRWAELTDNIAEVLALRVSEGYAVGAMIMEFNEVGKEKRGNIGEGFQALRNVIGQEGNELFGDKFNPDIAKESYYLILPGHRPK